jgi:LacI family transcriptional regulator
MVTMAKQSKPTLKDIASAVGVSYQAVSLALRGEKGVSEERRAEIKKLAKEMGYYPHAYGRLLREKKSNQVGLIIAQRPEDSPSASGFGQMLEYFVRACEQRDRRYHIEFHHHAEDDPDVDFTPPHAVAGGLVDGVILLGDVGQPLRDWLSDHQLPFVSTHEPAECSVIPDESQGMRLALEHLHDLGHRRVAATFGPQRYRTQRCRRRSFFDNVGKMGMEPPDEDYILIQESGCEKDWADQTLDWADALLDRPDRPTAVIGGFRAVHYAALSRGLDVPADLSLIEWTDPVKARQRFFPAATSIHADLGDIIHQAMEMLEVRLSGEMPENPQRWVPAELFPAESTGPVPTRQCSGITV